MRVLCLLILWPVFSSEADAQTAEESQADAVAAIKEMGGRVTFEGGDSSKPVIYAQLMSSTKVTDSGLKLLKGLTSLKRLDLGAGMTDSGLVHIKALNSLQGLVLIVDAGQKT